MLTIFKKLFGTKAERDLKAIQPYIDKIKEASKTISTLSNDELRAKTAEFKNTIADYIEEERKTIEELQEKTKSNDIDIQEKETLYNQIDKLEETKYNKTQEALDMILPEAFAVMKETAKRFKENEQIEVTASDFDKMLATKFERVQINGDKALYSNSWIAGGNRITWDMVHYDVQLIGGVVLHQGKIAEMATGEGKTLVGTLPIYLNALTGRGVHVVTVNDYLAKRDSEWMGVLFEFHGLSVDCIDKHKPSSTERRNAYLSDITYGTNNEFGFDYLRDNMTGNPTELVQREHMYCIVDEVDSVLIDDARTPLIISGPTPKGDKQEYESYRPIVQKLYNEQRILVNKIFAEAKSLLKNAKPGSKEEKEGAVLLFRSFRGLPKNKALIKFLSEQGMRTLMQKTENFYMQENNKNMHIIDDELYFTIDEKNNSIEPTDKGLDLLTEITGDSEFFVLPEIGDLIADLEKENLEKAAYIEKKNEVISNYQLKADRVHTVNQLLKAYALFEKDVEYVVMNNQIKIVDEQTGRIMEGRRYSDGLHQALEAKENVKVEAATQTYATITLQNYFRMYKKSAGMTGTAETEAGEFMDIYNLDVVVIPTNKPIIRDDREDLVYKTKREKFNAVINEVKELVKEDRPVLVGTTSVETSELLSRMLSRANIKHNVLNAKLHQREADIVAEAGKSGTVTIATNMAGRGTDIKLSPETKEAGGLAILGTERHDSRRVDRQLRGRSGRQGDPGSSQFFVSLEDDLMRMFGSERMSKIMDRLGIKEGEVIQHSMITKSIEKAQKKVEENNFGMRKNLLEYDDVMNTQREVIYKKRHHALYGTRLGVDISNMIYDLCERIVEEAQASGDYEMLEMEVLSVLSITNNPITKEELKTKKIDELSDKLFDIVYKNYQSKIDLIAEKAYPVIERVFTTQSEQYKEIAIPITDGTKTLQAIANLEKAYNDKGREIALAIEKNITLATIDNAWKEHLRDMDDLKQSVRNATYEQKDPLLIYKLESFNLFKDMIQRINKDIVTFLIRCQLPLQDDTQLQEARRKSTDSSKYREGRNDLLSQAHSNTQKQEITQPIRVEKKVGRNEPCPCGSGKKFKQCCGRAGVVSE
ncbi:MAG: preprotein translocase subunit SecA [Bacteroidetes bacterium]|nr:MAG: preprotein translocase subunit SecA [Bacteroidota bacterium]